jgi:MoxR-like ATPase
VFSLLDGRYNLAYEDIRAAVHPALRHRLALNFEAETRGLSADAVLDEILKVVPEVPR